MQRRSPCRTVEAEPPSRRVQRPPRASCGHRLRPTPWLLPLVLLAGWPSAAPAVKELERDDQVLVFQSMAFRDGDAWVVPVRGRVYEPEHSVVRRRLFAKAVQAAYGVQPDAAGERILAERVDWFVADGESGRRVRARVAGETFEVGESDDNGYFSRSVRLAADALEQDGTLVVRVSGGPGDERVFSGRVIVPPAGGVMVVSDIDDTVKVTNVTDHARMIESTFYREFVPAPGMAALYRRWRANGAAFHYVSSSPWQLYAPLLDFLSGAGFPAGALHLKTAHLTDETLLELFKPGTETKPAQIEPLLVAYPRHRFVLVGDSGEQDPEVYAALLDRYPDRIARVYIRNVTGAVRDDERFAGLFAGVAPDRWQLFTDPATLRDP